MNVRIRAEVQGLYGGGSGEGKGLLLMRLASTPLFPKSVFFSQFVVSGGGLVPRGA